MDVSSVAKIAAVYDPKAFFATEHWKAEDPWTGYGITQCDHFNHWFINSQQRTFSRMAAPFDSIYRSDLTSADARRFQLLFMVNLFTMDRAEADRIRHMLEGSGATVVWYYAPGLLLPAGSTRADGAANGVPVRDPPRSRSDADPGREDR